MNKKAIFINTASQIAVRFLTLALTLVSIKLLANYIGAVGLGQYNTITTYINFFIVFADLGLFSVTVREIAKKPEDEKKIISNVFVVRLFSALLASLIAILIVLFTGYDSTIKLGVLISSGFLLFNLLGSVYDIILQYRLKMQYSALAEFLSKALSILALFVIIRLGGGFLLIMTTVALYGFLIYIFKWTFARRFIIFKPKYNKEISRWIFGLSWPIGVVFIMNNIFMKLDTLMLFVMKGAAAAGLYTVAYKVLEVTAFFGAYFASSLKPTISKLIENDKKAVADIIRKALYITVFIAAPITLVSVAFSTEIILFLSSPEFLMAGRALILLGLTLPLVFIDVLLSEILIANDERKLLIKIFIFIVILNFVLNLILIPTYSFMGAALATLISEIVLMVINIRATKKIIPYSFDSLGMLKILTVSILSITLAFSIKQIPLHFLILMAITLVAYGLLAFIFRIFSKETFLELFSINKKDLV